MPFSLTKIKASLFYLYSTAQSHHTASNHQLDNIPTEPTTVFIKIALNMQADIAYVKYNHGQEETLPHSKRPVASGKLRWAGRLQEGSLSIQEDPKLNLTHTTHTLTLTFTCAQKSLSPEPMSSVRLASLFLIAWPFRPVCSGHFRVDGLSCSSRLTQAPSPVFVLRPRLKLLLHLSCMSFAPLPLGLVLFLKTLAHGTIQVITWTKEAKNIMLFVTLFK